MKNVYPNETVLVTRAGIEALWLAKTKPPGSLGRLEQVAAQMGWIQGTEHPRATPAALLLFAGDHGVHDEGVSPYPQSVTMQMVENIAAGGAASSVLASHHHIDYCVIDVGLSTAPAEHHRIVNRNVRRGSRNLRRVDAMTIEETHAAVAIGRDAVTSFASNAAVLIVGEMGIANTTSASAVIAGVLGAPAHAWVGAGTGLDASGITHKQRVIDDALSRGPFTSPVATLAALGGFELAAMTGAYLEAAAQRKVVLVDGFIATAALLVATRIEPKVIDMCIFSHCSDEQGHRALLRELGGTPLLELGMRLGEGSGALVAYPLLVQSCELLARMATFSSARVDTRR